MKKNEKELLVKAGQALYGERWQTELARDLGLPDGRRLRQWMSYDRPIPDTLLTDLSALLVARKAAIDSCLNEVNSALPHGV